MVLKVIADNNQALPYYTYIDISQIIAIDAKDSPQMVRVYSEGYHRNKTFKVYFNRYELDIDMSCYDEVLSSWLLLKNKDRKDIELCNTLSNNKNQ